MASKEQLDERRVKEAYKKYTEARVALDEFMQANSPMFEEAYDLTDKVNVTRKRLEQACRETGIGVGPITAVRSQHVTFNVDYLESLFRDEPEVLEQLIVLEKKVQKKAFEALVSDGTISRAQAQKAIADTEDRIRLNGLPTEIVLP
jgi:hypothetical protein